MVKRAPQHVKETTEEEKLWTVSELNQSIAHVLGESFSEPFWVEGELQGFDRDVMKASSRRWGQVYFELTEKEEGRDAIKASSRALIWGDSFRGVQRKLHETAGELSLRDGLHVKLKCTVDFYWPRATLQLKVLDVDPQFTLGDLERARRALLEKLKVSGLYDANRSQLLPPAPVRVGLITSEGSAAYHDFIEELKASGYSFHVQLNDARMQGVETETSVCRALHRLGGDTRVDVIVLIRGGGSRSDLVWFDREKVALAIAKCPKPVVTGIGHEIDLSVADLVAYAHQKTPTAAAQYLIENVRDFESSLENSGTQIFNLVREQLSREKMELGQRAQRWRESSLGFLIRRQNDLDRHKEGMVRSARQLLRVKNEHVRRVPDRLRHLCRILLQQQSERMTLASREVTLKDPRQVLRKGYALLSKNGKIIKSVEEVQKGDSLQARLRDGWLGGEVLSKEKSPLKIQ